MFSLTEAALVAAGLASSSKYLDSFKEQKISDSIVRTCLKYKSLRSRIEKIIPITEDFDKFAFAFNNPGVEPPSSNNLESSSSQNSPKPVPNHVVGTPSDPTNDSNKTDLGLNNGSQSEALANQRIPSSAATTSPALSPTPPPPFSNQLGNRKPIPSRSQTNSDSKLDPFQTISKYVTNELKSSTNISKSQTNTTGCESPKIVYENDLENGPKSLPASLNVVKRTPSPAKSSFTLNRNRNTDFKALLKLSGAPGEEPFALVKPASTLVNGSSLDTGSSKEIPLKAPSISSQNNSIIVSECLSKYDQDVQILQQQLPRPFSVQEELQNFHKIAQEWTLTHLQENYRDSNVKDIKLEIETKIEEAFKLICAQNTIQQNTSFQDAIVKLELYLISLMKEKLTRLCTDPDDDFILEETFESIYTESEISCKKFFQELLMLDIDLENQSENYEHLSLVTSFRKTLDSLKESMQLHNTVRKLQAENQQREEITKLTNEYKTQMYKSIEVNQYWTDSELKKKDDSTIRDISSKYTVLYQKSSIFRQGKLKLQESVREESKNIKRLVQMRNEKYFMNLSYFVCETANNYAKKMKEIGPALEGGAFTHNEVKGKCVNILKNFTDFRYLEPQKAENFVADLSARIESSYQETISQVEMIKSLTPAQLSNKDIIPVGVAYNRIEANVFNPTAVHYETPPEPYRPPQPPPPRNQAYDSFTYTVHDFKPTPTVGRAGGFYVEESELRSCIKNEMLGTSVIDVYASIIHELYGNGHISYLPSTGMCFTGGQWRVAHYLQEMIVQIKSTASPSTTTVATIVSAGWHWMLFVANVMTQEIQIADTLGGFCNPRKLNDGVKLLEDSILTPIFGSRSWNTKYFKGIVKQDDGHSCGPAALYFLDKLYCNLEIRCDDPSEYKKYRKTIVERILQTTDAGNVILQSNGEYTRYLNSARFGWV